MYGPPNVLMNTLKATMQHFEESLPMCFLHPHWAMHRSKWLKAVNGCDTVEKFAYVLALLEANIKPVLFNPAWHDSLGETYDSVYNRPIDRTLVLII